MLPVLAIASAIAFGGSFAFGRQSKVKRRKSYIKHLSGESSTEQKSIDSGNAVHSSHSLSQDLYPGGKKVKKGIRAIRKVFAISMGGLQDRDRQFHRLSEQGKSGTHLVDRRLDRRIKISIGLMGLAVTGAFFYTPLFSNRWL